MHNAQSWKATKQNVPTQIQKRRGAEHKKRRKMCPSNDKNR